MTVLLFQQVVGGRPPQYAPAQACKLTFDILTLKLVSESRVAIPLCQFRLLRSRCSRLRPDVRDRQTDVRQTSDAHHRL